MKRQCKGQGLANKFKGCAELSNKRRYGLCPSCLYTWSKTTDEGIQWLERQKLRVEKEKAKEKRKEKKEQRYNNMSVSKYRSNILQPIFNEIARLIDYGSGCIATDITTGKMNGGHRWSVGANPTLSLNLHNIHLQSFHSNHWKSGDETRYDEGLENRYGIYYKDFVYLIRQCPPLHLTKDDLREIAPKARKIRNQLRKELKVYTSKERIELRNKYNDELGIYPNEFSIFKNP